MCNIAFNIAGAADAASVSEATIVAAVRKRELVAREVDGKSIILSTDIQEWLTAQPDLLAS
jgi:hypothetical protein